MFWVNLGAWKHLWRCSGSIIERCTEARCPQRLCPEGLHAEVGDTNRWGPQWPKTGLSPTMYRYPDLGNFGETWRNQPERKLVFLPSVYSKYKYIRQKGQFSLMGHFDRSRDPVSVEFAGFRSKLTVFEDVCFCDIIKSIAICQKSLQAAYRQIFIRDFLNKLNLQKFSYKHVWNPRFSDFSTDFIDKIDDFLFCIFL